jgi:hypothetical protein
MQMQILKTKPVPFTGNASGLCGLFALGNLFDDVNFTTDDSTIPLGYTFEMLSRICEVRNIALQTVQMQGASYKSIDGHVSFILSQAEDNLVCGIAQITVRDTPHAVAVVFDYTNNTVYVFDSTKVEAETMPLFKFKFNRLALFFTADKREIIAAEVPDGIDHLFYFE